MTESENAGRNAGMTRAAVAAQGSAASVARHSGAVVIELFKRPARTGDQEYLRGVADGAALRAQGAPISPYLSVGIDDYAAGFRAGYYRR
jgi:hypothetical protein